MRYIQITSSCELPDLSFLRPFKAAIVLEDAVTPDRQAELSRWLVGSGCLYLMAWGEQCRSLSECVELANFEEFDLEEIPDDSLVIATWHEDEQLTEVFWFSKYSAMHPCAQLDDTVLLHLSSNAREQELREKYSAV